MKPIAIAEIVSAVFMFLILISNGMKKDKSTSMKRLKLLSAFTIIWLLSDALAYCFIVPESEKTLVICSIHFLNLLVYCMSNVVLFSFLFYCESYLREKTNISKLLFKIPMAITLFDALVVAIYYFHGQLVTYQNGMFIIVGRVPDMVLLSYLLLMFYAPLVTFIKREEVGIQTTFSLLLCGLPTLASIVVLAVKEEDFSVIAGSITVFFVALSLQKDITRNGIEENANTLALAENTERMLALEDSFESLYDVNLESGRGVCYVKGDFYKLNVEDKIENTDDFFANLEKNVNQVVYPEDRAELLHILSQEAIIEELSHNDHFDYFYRIITEEGPVWFKIRIVYKNDKKKNIIIGTFNASHDVEAKQIADQKEQLEKALALAETANKAKSEFLFNMSHDIRTPMNAITGFTTMAKKYAYDETKVREYLDKIDASGNQLLTLVNQVLEMARIESGQIILEEKPVNIQEEFDTLVTILSGQAQAEGLSFEPSLKNIKHYNVYADEARMSSITLNIAGNAMKFTPEGGKIKFILEEVEARQSGHATYKFTVSDDGIGMSDKFQKKIFEPFAREQNSTVSKIQGTGLGMSIVKKLVDYMKGDIQIKSKLGSGTSVSVTLDFKTTRKHVNPEAEDPDFQMGSLTGKRVLLVEDNEMNREIIRNILMEYGLVVEEADDGDIAVAKMADLISKKDYGYYDFILMDIQMPRMNGYDATKAIREMKVPKKIHIPIIAITANAFEEDRKNALEAGMDAHLAKPINIREMFKTLAKFV